MKSKNLTISTQLAIGFGAVVLVMLIVGGISLMQAVQIEQRQGDQ